LGTWLGGAAGTAAGGGALGATMQLSRGNCSRAQNSTSDDYK